jgi:hypothetical protein
MAALKELAITKVATTTGVDMQTAGKIVLYTVPSGKTFYPFAVCVRSPSATLAGGTEYDLGTGANADTWVQNTDLSAMTATTDHRFITPAAKYAVCAALSEFGIKVITGSTNPATAVIDVFGFLA